MIGIMAISNFSIREGRYHEQEGIDYLDEPQKKQQLEQISGSVCGWRKGSRA